MKVAADVPWIGRSQDLRERQVELFWSRLAEHRQRLLWSREQIDSHQLHSLNRLLTFAREHSSFYREHLASVPEQVSDVGALGALRPTTKQQLMDNWDRVCTDPGLSRARAEEFLADQTEFDFIDEQGTSCFVSGGSSGVRGVFPWSFEFLAEAGAVAFRHLDVAVAGGVPRVRAVMTAGAPPHASTPLFGLPLDSAESIAVVAAGQPWDSIASALVEANPRTLIGYPSVIAVAAQASARGNLPISPEAGLTNSEPLGDDARADMVNAWSASVSNQWGSTEAGIHAVQCSMSRGLHLAEDCIILERVDADNRPVADSEPAEQILVTNLTNLAFPIIRYAMNDVIDYLPQSCACGCRFRLIDSVAGRADDAFTYGDVSVAPIVFRHVLGRFPSVTEYQVRQTERGANVDVVGESSDEHAIAAGLVEGLLAAGLPDPDVTLAYVSRIARNPGTGKLRRFVPLPGAG